MHDPGRHICYQCPSSIFSLIPALALFPLPFLPPLLPFPPLFLTLLFPNAIFLHPPSRPGALRMCMAAVDLSLFVSLSLPPSFPPSLPPTHPRPSLPHSFLYSCIGVAGMLIGACSIGSRGSFDFEEQFARAHASAIFTFDPFLKPAVEEQMRALPFLHFRAIGLSGEADLQTYRRKNPTKLFVTLARLLALMNHTYVDVFKIDCEGCELEVIKDMTASYGSQPAKLAIHGGALPFGQILMEFHQ
ncbi:unnamed protein product [Closterium sp. NIES-54]